MDLEHTKIVLEKSLDEGVGITELRKAIKVAISLLDWEIQYGHREVREIVGNFKVELPLGTTDELDPFANQKMKVAGHIGYQLIELGLVEFKDTPIADEKKAVVKVLVPEKET